MNLIELLEDLCGFVLPYEWYWLNYVIVYAIVVGLFVGIFKLLISSFGWLK